MKRLTPAEVARRRVIERLDLSKGKGIIVANGKRFQIKYDDILDLVQAVEMIMLRLTGKVLNPKLRPEIRNRRALVPTKVIGGDYSLFEGVSPVADYTVCDVTEQLVKTHYLRIEIDGNVWDNWIGRLDELVKCLYIVVLEAQGDPYVPRPAFMLSAAAH